MDWEICNINFFHSFLIYKAISVWDLDFARLLV